MPTSLPISTNPNSRTGNRGPRRWLYAVVIVQVCFCVFLGADYWANIGLDKHEHYSLFNYYQEYPLYMVMGVSTVVAGIFVTAAAGVGMLKRAVWAPFLYVGWTVVALPSNLLHPHNLDMLRFPAAAFPVGISIYYIWVRLFDEGQTARSTINTRGGRPFVATTAPQYSPVALKTFALAVVSFAHASLFPLAAVTFFYALMSNDRRALALAAISLGSLTISALTFYHAVQVAAAA